MSLALPDIPPDEQTPLVLRLLDLLRQQQELIGQLRDEIARLKGLNPRPALAPSRLQQPAPPTPGPAGQRPGSAKRPRNATLTIHAEVCLPVPEAPPGSVVKGYEEYLVQELLLEPRVTRYLRQRVVTPDGRSLLAPLPPDVRDGCHFGPRLITFALHQYHHNHVTQPLLLEQLRQFGIDLSAGQLNRLLTEGQDAFHQEKDELLPAGLAGAVYVQVDDTGARHRGHNGSCLHIGNELFASFESTDSKSRLNFLDILRRPHTDYVVNEVAVAYWRRHDLPAEWQAALGEGPTHWDTPAAWQARLQELGVTAERPARVATEGALLGSLVAHGVSPQLVVLSDGAPQFDVLRHASCWIHAERALARLVPYAEGHRLAIEDMRDQIWQLYRNLKVYQAHPDPSLVPALQAEFDAVVEQRTGFPSVDGVLDEIAQHKADLLRVLEEPAVPLHNNTSESHLRDYVKKRKISGGTRSAAGRRCRDTFASLKKTCRCLGVSFWDYLWDRVRGLGQVGRLADLLRQATAEAGAGIGVAVPR